MEKTRQTQGIRGQPHTRRPDCEQPGACQDVISLLKGQRCVHMVLQTHFQILQPRGRPLVPSPGSGGFRVLP